MTSPTLYWFCWQCFGDIQCWPGYADCRWWWRIVSLICCFSIRPTTIPVVVSSVQAPHHSRQWEYILQCGATMRIQYILQCAACSRARIIVTMENRGQSLLWRNTPANHCGPCRFSIPAQNWRENTFARFTTDAPWLELMHPIEFRYLDCLK